ncbi:hypothetical protein Cgig2_017622 [Carnegiea gigantea]|uniref:Apple domain-containing protein n=1 Tax=Carnegiea gigantea TaxID=171969 RepID=A0A9Q1GVU6_9CARY|nr:hypothetical protein Cgig2_017622 [Carnegiea gigantea]
MKLCMFCLLALFFLFVNSGCSESDVPIGYTFTLAVPVEYANDFSSKAYLMETDQMPLNFRTALSIEAIDGRYACSLEIFLGNVKVWSSGHRSKFYTSEMCMLELTKMGDLRLKGPNEAIGWRTGTSGQGVEVTPISKFRLILVPNLTSSMQKLQLLESGNLVLVDTLGSIKWQTFNFPTNVLLEEQRLSVATHLTSFPTNNSTSFFSFEIHHDKVALYLNPGDKDKYPYWELKPPGARNITFIELSSRGLELFDDKYQKFSQILPQNSEPIRFLALDNSTGNLDLYYYSPYNDKFEASYQALSSTCDLPLSCSPYEICTSSKTCSCIIWLLTKREDNSDSDCSKEISNVGLCGKNEVDMLELEDAGTLLKSESSLTNMSRRECANSCLNDCNCAAAFYSSHARECMFYGFVRGAKQASRGSGLSYLVKVPKRVMTGNHKKSGLQNWALILIVVADGLVIFRVLGGLGCFMVWKRRKRSTDGANGS